MLRGRDVADGHGGACGQRQRTLRNLPEGAEKTSAVLPCMSSQRQDHVALDRADGVRHELEPRGDRPGAYEATQITNAAAPSTSAPEMRSVQRA